MRMNQQRRWGRRASKWDEKQKSMLFQMPNEERTQGEGVVIKCY